MRAVLLLRNLETSQRFIAPRLAGEAAQTQESGRGSGVQAAGPGSGRVRDSEWLQSAAGAAEKKLWRRRSSL